MNSRLQARDVFTSGENFRTGVTRAVLDMVVKSPSAPPGNRTPAIPFEYCLIAKVTSLGCFAWVGQKDSKKHN